VSFKKNPPLGRFSYDQIGGGTEDRRFSSFKFPVNLFTEAAKALLKQSLRLLIEGACKGRDIEFSLSYMFNCV